MKSVRVPQADGTTRVIKVYEDSHATLVQIANTLGTTIGHAYVQCVRDWIALHERDRDN